MVKVLYYKLQQLLEWKEDAISIIAGVVPAIEMQNIIY